MDARIVVKREFYSGTLCELDEDGYWKATSKIVDRVLYGDTDQWVEEELSSTSIDKDYRHAVQVAMSSCISYMVDNIYNKGFDGLIEFREFERTQEHATKTEDNKDS